MCRHSDLRVSVPSRIVSFEDFTANTDEIIAHVNLTETAILVRWTGNFLVRVMPEPKQGQRVYIGNEADYRCQNHSTLNKFRRDHHV